MKARDLIHDQLHVFFLVGASILVDPPLRFPEKSVLSAFSTQRTVFSPFQANERLFLWVSSKPPADEGNMQ